MASEGNAPGPLLDLAIRRAEEDPFFLGYALARYREGEGLNAAEVARRLGCTPAAARRLALCRRPLSREAAFAAGVRRIAAWAGVDPNALVNVLRYAEAVEVGQRFRPHADTGGMLLAARDVEGHDGAGSEAQPQQDDAGTATPAAPAAPAAPNVREVAGGEANEDGESRDA